ncbi:NACHT domain- and WD repeat-containing protein 1-like [Glandiceps talaboti]
MGCGASAVSADSKTVKNGVKPPRGSVSNLKLTTTQRNIEKDLKDILEGDMCKDCPSNAKIVRIFTSSTFTDTQHERNALMERVYPKLKKYCQERGYEFQIVDMRWGVRDEATDDHMATELCLREVEECQKVSTGPNFVTFLSHKYGYRPLPRKIPSHELETIFLDVKEDERALIERWYQKDDNELPSMHILQAVSTNIPNIKSMDRVEKSEAKDLWWETMLKLRQIMYSAAEKKLGIEELEKYKISVTEQEIYQGILKSHDQERTSLWFHRVFTNVKMEKTNPILGRFIETEDVNGDDATPLLESLKTDKLKRILPESNVKTYTVKWADEGINPEDITDHKKYINKLCDDFENTIRDKISAGITERAQSDIMDPLYEEVTQHVAFCQTKCELFHGREDTLGLIEDYMKSNRQVPLVVHGPSGSGKTSVVAMAAKMARTWVDGKAVVVLRFLGTTPNSSNIRRVLYSLVQQIYKVFGDDTIIPQDLKLLIRSLHDSMSKASKERPLVILLDSLDQLDSDDGAQQLSWLPIELPKHVKIIVSTLPEDEYQYYPRLKSLIADTVNFVEVPKLGIKDTQDILQKWFANQNRMLTENQMEIVVSACQECPLPLFLKISFDEACRWHSYSKPEEYQLKTTVRDAIVDLFERVETNHGELLVSHALGYLTAAKNGLTENELEDLLSLDDDVLNDVYQYWTPPIRRLPPLLWVRIRAELSQYLVDRGADGVRVMNWYHRQFIEAARDRYIKDDKIAKKLHSVLAEYFLGTWSHGIKKPYINIEGEKGVSDRLVATQPLLFDETSYNLRKLSELPHHLIESDQLVTLKQNVLCNLEWLYVKMKGTSLRSVREDFREALKKYPEDQQLNTMAQLIQLSQEALEHDPAQLAPQILARISQPKGFEDILDQARNPPALCLLPSFPFMTPPGGQLLNTLVGHKESINSLDVTADGSLILSGDDAKSFRLWDSDSGFLIKHVETETDIKMVKFCNEDRHFAVSLESTIMVFRTDTLAKVHELEPYGEEPDTSSGIPFAVAGVKKDQIVVPCHRKVLTFEVLTGEQLRRILDLKLLREYYEDVCIVAKGNIVAYYNEMLDKRSSMLSVIDLSNKDRKADFVDVYPDVKIDEYGDEDRTSIGALAITGDERIIVSNYMDNHLKIYDAKSLELLKTFEGNKDDMSEGFIITPDDRYLLFPNSGNVCMWDLEKGERSYGLEHPNSVEKVVTVDGQIVITAGVDYLIRIWDNSKSDSIKDIERRDWKFHKGDKGKEMKSDKPMEKKSAKKGKKSGAEKLKEDQEAIVDLWNIPDDKRHVFMHTKQDKSHSYTVWDCNLQKPLQRLDEPPRTKSSTWHILNKELAILNENRRLKLVNYTSGKIIRVFKGKTSYGISAYIVNNKKEVITGTRHNRNLKLYNISTGDVITLLKHEENKSTKESKNVSDLKVKSDGKGCVAVTVREDEEQMLYVWDITKRKLRHVMQLPVETGRKKDEQPTIDLSESDVSSDEHFFCCTLYESNFKTCPIVWNLDAGTYMHKLSHDAAGEANKVLAVGSDKLLTSYWDDSKEIWLWSLSTGKPLIQLPGHRSLEIDSMLVTEDERRLVSHTQSSQEREFILWDLEKGERIAGFTLEETNDIRLVSNGDVIVVSANSIGSVVTFTLSGPGCEKLKISTDKSSTYKDMDDVIPLEQTDGAADEKEDPDDIDSDEDSVAGDSDDGDDDDDEAKDEFNDDDDDDTDDFKFSDEDGDEEETMGKDDDFKFSDDDDNEDDDNDKTEKANKKK